MGRIKVYAPRELVGEGTAMRGKLDSFGEGEEPRLASGEWSWFIGKDKIGIVPAIGSSDSARKFYTCLEAQVTYNHVEQRPFLSVTRDEEIRFSEPSGARVKFLEPETELAQRLSRFILDGETHFYMAWRGEKPSPSLDVAVFDRKSPDSKMYVPMEKDLIYVEN